MANLHCDAGECLKTCRESKDGPRSKKRGHKPLFSERLVDRRNRRFVQPAFELQRTGIPSSVVYLVWRGISPFEGRKLANVHCDRASSSCE